MENDQGTFPAKDSPSRIYKKQDQLHNEQETSPAKDLRSSVYQSRPWTPEEDNILLKLTRRQRTALLSHKVITRSTISGFPGLERRSRGAVDARLRAIKKAASVWGKAIDTLQIRYWRHEHPWTLGEISTRYFHRTIGGTKNRNTYGRTKFTWPTLANTWSSAYIAQFGPCQVEVDYWNK